MLDDTAYRSCSRAVLTQGDENMTLSLVQRNAGVTILHRWREIASQDTQLRHRMGLATRRHTLSPTSQGRDER